MAPLIREGDYDPYSPERTPKKIVTKDFEVLTVDDIDSVAIRKLIKRRFSSDILQIVKFYFPKDVVHKTFFYVSTDDCHYASEEEFVKALYSGDSKNEKRKLRELERQKEDDDDPRSLEEIIRDIKGYHPAEDEIIPSSDRNAFPRDDDYEYEDELKQVRLERLDNELSVRRTFIVLRKRLMKLLKKYRATKYGNDPSYSKSELPGMEDSIRRLVEELKPIKSKLNWYNRSKTEESLTPDVITDFEQQEFEA